jgi:hypothetical protein
MGNSIQVIRKKKVKALHMDVHPVEIISTLGSGQDLMRIVSVWRRGLLFIIPVVKAPIIGQRPVRTS